MGIVRVMQITMSDILIRLNGIVEDGVGEGGSSSRVLCLKYGGLKVGYVECKRPIGRPLYSLRIGEEKLVGLWKIAAKIIELFTQIGERLRLGRIRPKEKRQMVAR